MEENSFAEARRLLEEHLVGEHYFRIIAGDDWALSFSNGLWLLAQELQSSFADELERSMTGPQAPRLGGSDPEDILVAAGIFRDRQSAVRAVRLEEDASLVLSFDAGRTLRCTTRSDICDWQWCLNHTGEGPYRDMLVACLWAGDVEVARDR